MADVERELVIRFTESGLEPIEDRIRQVEESAARAGRALSGGGAAGGAGGTPREAAPGRITRRDEPPSFANEPSTVPGRPPASVPPRAVPPPLPPAVPPPLPTVPVRGANDTNYRNAELAAMESRQLLLNAIASGSRAQIGRQLQRFNLDRSMLERVIGSEHPLLATPALPESPEERRARLEEERRQKQITQWQGRQMRGIQQQERMLQGVPEEDRPFVRREAAKRAESLLLSREQAMRDAVSAYNSGTREYQQFKRAEEQDQKQIQREHGRRMRGFQQQKRMLQGIPEEDRPFVRRDAAKRAESLLLSPEQAMRDAISAYRSGTREYEQFNRDENNVHQRMLRAEEKRFHIENENLPRRQQLAAVRSRMADIAAGGKPPGPESERYDEYMRLADQEKRLSRAQSMGLRGLFYAHMISGTVAGALESISTVVDASRSLAAAGQLPSSMASNAIMGYRTGMEQAVRSVPIAGQLGIALRGFYDRMTGGYTPEMYQRDQAAQEATDQIVRMRMGAQIGARSATVAALAAQPDYESRMKANRLAFETTQLQLGFQHQQDMVQMRNNLIQENASTANQDRYRMEAETMYAAWRAKGRPRNDAAFNPVINAWDQTSRSGGLINLATGEPTSADKNRIVLLAQAAIAAKEMSDKLNLDQKQFNALQKQFVDAASLRFTAQGKEITQQQNSALIALSTMRQVSLAQVRNDPFGAQMAQAQGQLATARLILEPEQQKAAVRAAAAGIVALSAQTLRGNVWSAADAAVAGGEMAFQMGGSFAQANVGQVEGQRYAALRQLPQGDMMWNMMGGSVMKAALNMRFDIARAQAVAQANQQVIAQKTQIESLQAAVQLQPLEAQFAQIAGQQQAALEPPRQLRLMIQQKVGSLAGSLLGSRAGNLIGSWAGNLLANQVINPDYIKRINTTADLQKRQAWQQVAFANISTGIGQETRDQQLNSILNFNPTAAQMQGIYGQSRSEELAAMASGDIRAAQRARELGQKQLDVFTMQYALGFRGTEWDLRNNPIDNPRDRENPDRTMRIYRGLRNDLNSSGQGSQIASGTVALDRDSITQLVNEFATRLANIVQGGN